ncbi:meprin A subunit alpha [Conger conger]|uniref:meprin A subunit alpha n=1 Tax=Conger conger TaxID=82655 RepID=UPI002A5A97DD|nr:meprin A subunit alpha [Conger conger]
MVFNPSFRNIVLTIGIIFEVQAIPALYDGEADRGELRDDIPEINLELFEGDIAGDPKRNAILDETARWKFPIPYILTDSLDLNAKGVILQAFEMYRLKSCVDFKPYEGEQTYLSFTKLSGCWSFVGDLHEGQNLSIGARCDSKAIVEHELLHALGFYHEQSRSDRDDYVKIWWDQIIPGKEHSFNKYEDDFITDVNTPYDYESIMHYRPLSFNKNETVPTITTTIPSFNDIIGQRLDFSAVDLVRLNRVYKCPSTVTLLDQCSFEQINICGMIQGEEDDADWVQTLSTSGSEDQTLVGRCRDAGYFMQFKTSGLEAGKSAVLESRILYPKRSQQCLQFFYKTTGNSNNMLVIWTKTDDGTGDVRRLKKVHTIIGDGDESWKIAHVTLNSKDKFRYVFQGIAGQNAGGGILVDDVTLSEARCPSNVWQIRNFTGLIRSTPNGQAIVSSPVYSTEGYGYGVSVYPNGNAISEVGYVSVYFHLVSTENDGVLEWPALNRQATIIAMDQDPDVRLRMSASGSFTTELSPNWEKPGSGGTWVESCQCYWGTGLGWSTFISHKQLMRRSFLKNDDLIITSDFEDLSHLVKSEVPVRPKPARPLQDGPVDPAEVPKWREARSVIADPCRPNPCLNGGVCVEQNGRASCRCASSQATFYTGAICEKQRIEGNVLGVLIGGAAGTVALTVAIIAVIRRKR